MLRLEEEAWFHSLETVLHFGFQKLEQAKLQCSLFLPDLVAHHSLHYSVVLKRAMKVVPMLSLVRVKEVPMVLQLEMLVAEPKDDVLHQLKAFDFVVCLL